MGESSQATTIVALATGSPDGALAVIRLSGPELKKVAERMGLALPPPRRASRKKIFLEPPQARPLDPALEPASGLGLTALEQGTGPDREYEEAIVIWMPGPHSFTGEDCLELQIHGGALNVQQVLARCLAAGAVAARRGEFSRRAFAHGKMTLDQAEGISTLLAAQSTAELQQARRLLRGELGEAVQGLRQSLFTLRIEIEAHLDFAEDVEERSFAATVQSWQGRVEAVAAQLRAWIKQYKQDQKRQSDYCVVLAGPPNAGKSSLFNALLGKQRALVSSRAGTTRDVVDSPWWIEGLPARLVDTAGVRESSDELEAAGIALGQKEIALADLVIWVEASDAPPVPEDLRERLLERREHMLVESKGDLGRRRDTWIGVAALDRESPDSAHLHEIYARVHEHYRSWQEQHPSPWLGLARHVDCARRALSDLEAAVSQLQGDTVVALELVAFNLGSAESSLNEIIGRDHSGPVGEEVLHAIFSSFCIGK